MGTSEQLGGAAQLPQRRGARSYDAALIGAAVRQSLVKLHPRRQIRNPVMFVVWVGALLTSALSLQAAVAEGDAPAGFVLSIALWLWFTVLFANFAESMAESRGRAQAESLRQSRQESIAKVLPHGERAEHPNLLPAHLLIRGQIVLVEAGDTIPCDGEVLQGIASVDESAITGESAPVIRESGGDRSAVTGGTRVLSDWLMVRCSASHGDSFLDRMIALVEGAKRKKTPNEVALEILLAGLSIVFLIVTACLRPYSHFAVAEQGSGAPVGITVLVALLVCLIPTTIGGLLSAIGIAGMDRMIRKNVVATSGRAVEAAGDVDVLLLDKTGTITLGNRQAVAFLAARGVDERALADAAQLASLADETPEGRSIVVLAKARHAIRERDIHGLQARFVAFSAHTRMSGVDVEGARIRKGAPDAIKAWILAQHRAWPSEIDESVRAVALTGGTPLVVANDERVLGVVHLKDVLKGGIKERFAELRRMGIKTVMITGDNALTAAAIAAEAGVDDYLAEATPEAKLRLIRDYQSRGHLVAMTGDGTNDAPALAQADVAVAMNSGTQAAKEAGNMVDLDSNPTKLIEVVETGKQMLMTRGALTTFSIANDVAKYFAIVPAAFVATYPELGALDLMHLGSPTRAILSAVIFNALIIVVLIPLALRGVTYRPRGAAQVLRRNLLLFGAGGLVVPFIGIKAVDMLLGVLGVA